MRRAAVGRCFELAVTEATCRVGSKMIQQLERLNTVGANNAIDFFNLGLVVL
jgi:hypothetical protein